jgi:hypothetical protein
MLKFQLGIACPQAPAVMITTACILGPCGSQIGGKLWSAKLISVCDSVVEMSRSSAGARASKGIVPHCQKAGGYRSQGMSSQDCLEALVATVKASCCPHTVAEVPVGAQCFR